MLSKKHHFHTSVKLHHHSIYVLCISTTVPLFLLFFCLSCQSIHPSPFKLSGRSWKDDTVWWRIYITVTKYILNVFLSACCCQTYTVCCGSLCVLPAGSKGYFTDTISDIKKETMKLLLLFYLGVFVLHEMYHDFTRRKKTSFSRKVRMNHRILYLTSSWRSARCVTPSCEY